LPRSITISSPCFGSGHDDDTQSNLVGGSKTSISGLRTGTTGCSLDKFYKPKASCKTCVCFVLPMCQFVGTAKSKGMSEDWVRHEVVAVIVVRHKIGDTTRCPISGILRRCAGR
jgi:hypothetical protein